VKPTLPPVPGLVHDSARESYSFSPWQQRSPGGDRREGRAARASPEGLPHDERGLVAEGDRRTIRCRRVERSKAFAAERNNADDRDRCRHAVRALDGLAQLVDRDVF
jgi:hypothetical protein